MSDQHRLLILHEGHEQTGVQYFRVTDLSRQSGLRPDMIRRLVNLGLIDPIRTRPEPLFEAQVLLRLRKMLRLHRDLGIGWTSLGLVMDLLDRVRDLEAENSQLRQRLR